MPAVAVSKVSRASTRSLPGWVEISETNGGVSASLATSMMRSSGSNDSSLARAVPPVLTDLTTCPVNRLMILTVLSPSPAQIHPNSAGLTPFGPE